jgi:hypothetical protein
MRRTLLLTAVVVLALPLTGAGSPPPGLDAAPDALEPPAGSAAVLATQRADTSDPADAADALGAAPSPGAPADPIPTGDVGPSLGPGRPRTPGTTGIPSPEGFIVTSGREVRGEGPRWRYTVEVEPATGLDPTDVLQQVQRALNDGRSWSRSRTLEQVEDPTAARIRVVVATPETVDALCAKVGLRTMGIFSCWNGRIAALNSWRWDVGASGFDDLATYRTYLINHEFGHGLGYGHVGCPSLGAPAPVMMQQTKGLDGCAPNGWPYP